jgi:hypothetical protein
VWLVDGEFIRKNISEDFVNYDQHYHLNVIPEDEFWIDKESLAFVRLLQPAGWDGAQTQEVQYNKYERLSGGWISPEVIIKLDDKIIMTEEYSEIKAGVKLDPRLFDPQHWQTARWR